MKAAKLWSISAKAAHSSRSMMDHQVDDATMTTTMEQVITLEGHLEVLAAVPMETTILEAPRKERMTRKATQILKKTTTKKLMEKATAIKMVEIAKRKIQRMAQMALRMKGRKKKTTIMERNLEVRRHPMHRLLIRDRLVVHLHQEVHRVDLLHPKDHQVALHPADHLHLKDHREALLHLKDRHPVALLHQKVEG